MLSDLAPKLPTTTDLEELFTLVATSYRDMYSEFGKDLDILSVIGGQSQVVHATRDQLAASSTRMLDEARAILERAGVADTELTLALLWSTVTGLADHSRAHGMSYCATPGTRRGRGNHRRRPSTSTCAVS